MADPQNPRQITRREFIQMVEALGLTTATAAFLAGCAPAAAPTAAGARRTRR